MAGFPVGSKLNAKILSLQGRNMSNTTTRADFARQAIEKYATQHVINSFVSIIKLIEVDPEIAAKSRKRNAPAILSDQYIQDQAISFLNSRAPKAPKAPETVPDEMVSFVLEKYFSIPAQELPEIKRTHQLSMGAENIIGELVERYLASVLEPLGWAWCSGAMIKAIDFVKPPDLSAPRDSWVLLQVKNRDNTENSSSSAIRNGTEIKKWFRTFALNGNTNWEAFSVFETKAKLDEQGFKKFVTDYLANLPKQS